jgi:ornithine cyclodeaminase
LHAIGAVIEGAGVVGTKSWAHTGGGATPLLLLWGAEDGRLLAVIEAFALGQMRTGGISGVATRWLAPEGADELAIIGTGKQAVTQAAAVAAVRPLRRIRVFSPTPENRQAFVAKLAKLLPEIAVREAASVEAALDGAPIVTLVTRARQPFLSAGLLGRGTHLNAVGAITPEREEFTQDVFDRTDAIAVDNLGSVQALSAEFRRRFAEDWSAVRPLSALVAGGMRRPPAADLTLFKAMGMGLSDLALGIEILTRVRQSGGGRPLPHPQRMAPRLRA